MQSRLLIRKARRCYQDPMFRRDIQVSSDCLIVSTQLQGVSAFEHTCSNRQCSQLRTVTTPLHRNARSCVDDACKFVQAQNPGMAKCDCSGTLRVGLDGNRCRGVIQRADSHREEHGPRAAASAVGIHASRSISVKRLIRRV